MKNILTLRWRWIGVPAALVSFVLAALAIRVFERTHDFGIRHVTSDPFRIDNVARMELQRAVRRAADEVRPRQRQRSVRTINLLLDEQARANLDARLPHTGENYVAAGIEVGGVVLPVKVRYRGDNAYHWGYYKKSWRVRTTDDALFEGMETFNLVAPRSAELLNNHLAFLLARRLGLLAPRSQIVELAVNGETQGVYILTEQVGEGVLRASHYMPGDIYSGEAIARDTPVGVDQRLFTHLGLWNKVAHDSRRPEDSMAPLQALLAALSEPNDSERARRVSTLVDLEAWGAFAAFELLASTLHYDDAHNWRLYWDPWRGRFSPIVWDAMAWHASSTPSDVNRIRLDTLTSSLHLALATNHGFLRARHEALAAFFEDGKNVTFLTEAEREVDAAIGAVQVDTNLAFAVRWCSPEESEAALRELLPTIRRVFEAVRRGHLQSRPTDQWSELEGGGQRIALAGRTPTSRLRFELSAQVRQAPRLEIRWLSNGQLHSRDISRAVTAHGNELTVDVSLLADHAPVVWSLAPERTARNAMSVSAGVTEWAWTNWPEEARVREIFVDRRDALTGKSDAVRARRAKHIEWNDYGSSIEIVRTFERAPTLVWSGTVEVNGVQEVESDVRIEPGAVIRLGPQASLLLRGKVLALGAPSAPIRFVGASDRPWGVIALLGSRCSGSEFVHCQFEGGSSRQSELEQHSGMLSLQDCGDVRIAACEFGPAPGSQSSIHVLRSHALIERTRVFDASADAIECDCGSLRLSEVRIEGPAKCGLDLMDSRATIVDSDFANCGASGIRADARSWVFAGWSAIRASQVGLEALDGSRLHGLHLELLGNDVTARARAKDGRYRDGGRAELRRCWIEAEGQDTLQADRASRVRIEDSGLVLGELVPASRSVALLNCSGDRAPSDGASALIPPEFREQLALAPEDLARNNHSVRGSPTKAGQP